MVGVRGVAGEPVLMKANVVRLITLLYNQCDFKNDSLLLVGLFVMEELAGLY